MNLLVIVGPAPSSSFKLYRINVLDPLSDDSYYLRLIPLSRWAETPVQGELAFS